MEANGWRLFVHPLLQMQLETLTAHTKKLAAADPNGYAAHPATKLLATIRRLILEAIPADPNAREFRQGNTLGPGNRHWFRAKFHSRYRLFYRFSSQQKVIVYVWVNDGNTLRKAGSRTDPYAMFRAMLESGHPTSDFAQLLQASKDLRDS
jgi:toxin YhaV